MADAIKSTSRPQYCHDAAWLPLSYRWPSVIFNQHFGLPPLLDPRDLSWIEGIFRRLGTSSWPGYLRTPVFSPFTQSPGQQISKLHREMSGGLSEVTSEMHKLKISLDVNHFAPSEITVKIQDGFLEIAAKHEEREDEHGYIARCFTRKYKLPIGVEAETVQSFLSADGILTVEASLSSVTLPGDVIIPVQVEMEAQTIGREQQDDREPQGSDEAEGEPQSFEEETSKPSASAEPEEHLEGGREIEGLPADQQTESDISHPALGQSEEPPTQSISEQALDTSEPERVQDDEATDVREEEEKEGTFQEAADDAERVREEVHESADKPQAPETPDTLVSEEGEQAEVSQDVQPQEFDGEGHTETSVTEDEQSTSWQTQQVFSPQLELQQEVLAEQKVLTK